jgi:hypothetical protein
MSDEPPRQNTAPSREFLPGVKPLEDRCLLSFAGSSGFSPLFHLLPRTGGVSAQSGSMLAIGVGQPTTNSVQLTDDGKGEIQAEWNGGPVHSFTTVATTVIQAERARTNQITLDLASPRTGPAAIAVGSLATAAAATSHGGDPTPQIRVARTSGTAVQTGSLLTVTVTRPKTNLVQITNEGGGAVQVEWNGGPVHSFSGVAEVVVDTRNARKDQVTLDERPEEVGPP